MKKLVYLFSLFFVVSLHAQLNVGNVSLNFGEKITNKDGSVVKIGGVVNKTIFALAKNKKNYFLQSFDSSTKKFKKSISLKLDKINGNKVIIEDVVVINNKAFLTASYYDKSSKKNNFIIKEVTEDLKLSKHEVVLSVDVKNKKKKGVFLYDVSYDDFNYFVSHVGINEKDEKLSYSFVLLDSELNTIVKDTYTTTFEDRKDLEFDFSSFVVNEHGDVFITTTESYRDKASKTTVNNIILHSYLENKNYEKQELNISLKGKKALNCSLIETKKNGLHMVGFYSDLKKSGKAEKGLEGIFDITVNYQENKEVKKSFNDFTFDVKKKLLGERRAKKDKDLKPFYRNTYLIEKEDGGIYVMSEYFLEFVGRSSGIGPLAFTPITYDANEIIVTSLNPDGSLKWSNVIPKEQRVTVQQMSFALTGFASNGNVTVSATVMFPLTTLGRGPEYLSSLPFYKDGKLTVIVNDDPKNIGITDMDDVKKVRNVNKMIPVAFSFDESNGNLERVDPKDFEKRQIVVQPVVSYQLNENEVIIYGSNSKGSRLGTMKMN